VVTASKRPERISKAASIISVMTEEDIEQMGARTIMDVLGTIPGMEIVQDRSALSQIAVRGFGSETSSGVKILVDGHSLNDPLSGGATWFYDDLPLKNVKRIEIIRGPASAIYGANAFVSVINIITKSAHDIDGVDVSIGAGNFQTFNPSFLFGKIINELEVTLYADYYTTEGADLSLKRMHCRFMIAMLLSMTLSQFPRLQENFGMRGKILILRIHCVIRGSRCAADS
jgi:iron complex outermembrane receptor protein